MEMLEENLNDLFQEIVDRALEEGALSHEEWKTIVDDVLQQHEEFGELNDERIESVKTVLYDRFSEFEDSIPTA